MRLGQSFYFSPRTIDPHLWMVLSDPDRNEMTVIANASTKNGGHSGLTEIALGEHNPPLAQLSYIRWDRIRVEPTVSLRNGLRTGLIELAQDLSHTLLHKAQQGLLGSSLARNDAKRILNDQGLFLLPL